MAFTASKIFWWVASPGNLLLVLAVAAAVAGALGRRRGALWLTALLASAMAAIALLPVRDWVLVPLEHRFPALATTPPTITGVILLGGAINGDLGRIVGQPVLNDAAERVTAFVTLARRHPEARMVFSGGSGSLRDDAAREADAARGLLADLGLPADRVLFERDSRNTEENARFSKALVTPAAGETWLLVTSAYHMPRSVGVFRRAGWPVIPYPVDYSVPPAGWGGAAGFLDGLTGLHWGMKEWIGLAYYRAMGWTDRFFPGPAD
jgi:uncharacterized SAM-binding protein YcdF (DUF218 family)